MSKKMRKTAVLLAVAQILASVRYDGVQVGSWWWEHNDLHVLANEWTKDVDIHVEWVIHAGFSADTWWLP